MRYRSVACVIGFGKKAERMLCQSFCDGARRHGIKSDVVPWSEVNLGAFDAVALPGARKDTTVCVYRECLRIGKPFFYMDNGYFSSRWHTGWDKAAFRITLNGLQHDGCGGPVDERRFDALGIEVLPWKRCGPHESILIAAQSDWWYELNGTSKDEFLRSAFHEISGRRLDRTVFVRDKPMTRAMLDASDPIDWRSTFAVVAHSSAVAFEAILRGIPGFCLGKCAAWALIDPKTYDLRSAPEIGVVERLRWARVLASNQWTLDEISRGEAWESLTSR